MSRKIDNPYAELETLFHVPNRLAIVSALAGAPTGLTFAELKAACNLTDGNLSRHLKALQAAGAVRIEKEFVAARPQTTVFLSPEGRDNFLRYLQALESVLKEATRNAVTMQKTSPPEGQTRLAPG